MNILRMDELLLATRNMGKERKGEKRTRRNRRENEGKVQHMSSLEMLPPTILPIGPRF